MSLCSLPRKRERSHPLTAFRVFHSLPATDSDRKSYSRTRGLGQVASCEIVFVRCSNQRIGNGPLLGISSGSGSNLTFCLLPSCLRRPLPSESIVKAMPSVKITTSAGNADIFYTVSTPSNDNADIKDIDRSVPTLLFIHAVYLAQEIFQRTSLLPLLCVSSLYLYLIIASSIRRPQSEEIQLYRL